jgi:very-short-patch-repair endonuclease
MSSTTQVLVHDAAAQEERARSASHRPAETTHTVTVLGPCTELVVWGPLDQRIGMIANMQNGRVSRRQLLAAGISDTAIRKRIKRSRLLPLHPGVYAVGHLAPVGLGAETAALLSCRAGAVLSHRTAASLWGLHLANVSDTDPVDILIPAAWTGGRDGVRIHRTRSFDERDVRVRHGLPVTAPPRMLLDLAPELSDRRLELTLDQLIVAKLIHLADVADLLARIQRHPGRAKLAQLAADQQDPTLTRSEAEERLLELIRASQLPAPRVNTRLLGFEVDFHWRAERFVLEVDGFRFHSTRRAFEHDRRKDAALRAAGITTMRVTWRQLEAEPFAVVARVAQAMVWSASPAGTVLPEAGRTGGSGRRGPLG